MNIFFSGLDNESLVVGLARIGSSSQKIVAGSLVKLANFDLGPPLHSLIIPSRELHPLEIEYLEQFRIN